MYVNAILCKCMDATGNILLGKILIIVKNAFVKFQSSLICSFFNKSLNKWRKKNSKWIVLPEQKASFVVLYLIYVSHFPFLNFLISSTASGQFFEYLFGLTR